MRKFFSVFIVVFFLFGVNLVCAEGGGSPTKGEKLIVDSNDLPPEVLEKIKAKQKIEEVKQKIEAAGEYATWGKQIGTAVNESLTALTKHAEEFSNTKVGKVAVFLIAWKVMAKDVLEMGDKVIGYFVGIPFLFFGTIVIILGYRRHCIPRKVLIEKTKEGKKWQMFTPKEKKQLSSNEWDGDNWALFYAIVEIVLIIFCSLMIFG